MRFILPFAVVLLAAAFAYVGVNMNSREISSPLIGKPAPAFTLPQLHDPSRQFSPQDMKGKVWIFNFWASWCSACEIEHPVFMDLSRRNLVPVYGMDYRDKREEGEAWLRKHGNPYTLTVFDAEGRVGVDYGVNGVPETYVIDKQGIIRFKQIGTVTTKMLNEKILPLVKELQAK